MELPSLATATLLAATLHLALASRLTCYSCRDSRGESNNTCLNMPADTTDYVAVCDRTFCYIKRVQVAQTGSVHLVERGCVESVPTGVQLAGTLATYVRTCNSSLCNDWDGVQDRYPASSHGSAVVSTGGANGDDSVVILAPGQGSTAAALQPGAWVGVSLLPLLLLFSLWLPLGNFLDSCTLTSII